MKLNQIRTISTLQRKLSGYLFFIHHSYVQCSLPYTEAFLMEAQRMSSVAPLGVPHYNTTKTQIGNYAVPKVFDYLITGEYNSDIKTILSLVMQGSIVLLNYFDIHNDEDYWGDPHIFRPERHISADGKLLRSDHFLPFGQGKFCKRKFRFSIFFFT